MPLTREPVNDLIRLPRSLASRLRVLRLRLLGARIGRRCWLRSISVPRNPWDVEISHNASLDDGVVLLTTGERTGRRRLRIGPRTYVNRYTIFDASDAIEVGEDCLIGPFCYITDHDHGRGIPYATQRLAGAPVKIGNNVWLGAGVIVLKGVTIGDNVVVGAGAVVTRSIKAGKTVAGVPARQLIGNIGEEEATSSCR